MTQPSRRSESARIILLYNKWALNFNSIESWPFKVVDQDGSPMVEVEYLGENKIFSPQEISSMVLTKVSPKIIRSDQDTDFNCYR